MPLKMTSVAKFDVHRLRRNAEHLHSAADAHERERLVDRGTARPTSRARRRRRVRRSRPSRRPRPPAGARRRARPSRRASASRRSFTSDAMMRDAPAALQMPTAKMPIGPHPVIEHRRAGNLGRERRVERVAHRIVDAADVVRDVVVEVPDVRRRHRDVLGEAAVAVDADDACVRADVRVAGAAQQAASVDDVALGGHAVAFAHIGDELADFARRRRRTRARRRTAACTRPRAQSSQS